MEPRISIITPGVNNLNRSCKFYHGGLGFSTTQTPASGIIFFQTGGTCLALYPLEKLAKDISPNLSGEKLFFSGITLAHNTRKKKDVEKILNPI